MLSYSYSVIQFPKSSLCTMACPYALWTGHLGSSTEISEPHLVCPCSSVGRPRAVQTRGLRSYAFANPAEVEEFSQLDQFYICLNLLNEHSYSEITKIWSDNRWPKNEVHRHWVASAKSRIVTGYRFLFWTILFRQLFENEGLISPQRRLFVLFHLS